MRRLVLPLLVAFSVVCATALGADAKKSASPDVKFCSVLKSMIDAAGDNFHSWRGPVDKIDQNDDPIDWKAKTPLPGAQECTVWPDASDEGAWVTCTMASTTNATKAQAAFQAALAKVQACLPADEWVADKGADGKGLRSQGDMEQLFTDFHRKAAPGSYYVTVSDGGLKGKPRVVKVDVTIPDPAPEK